MSLCECFRQSQRDRVVVFVCESICVCVCVCVCVCFLPPNSVYDTSISVLTRNKTLGCQTS